MAGFSPSDRQRVAQATRSVESLLMDQSSPNREARAEPSRVPVSFRNTSSETVPPFAVLEVLGGGGIKNLTPYLNCGKPGDGSGKVYAVNNGRPVAANKFGECFLDLWCVVFCDGAPALGEAWGPSVGQWSAVLGGGGLFTMLAVVNTDKHWAIAKFAGGGTGNDAFSFVLRSDLGEGGTAIAEKTIIRAAGTCAGYGYGYGYGGDTKKQLCTRSPREFCRVIDRLGEFTGTKDVHCGIAWRLSDTWATWAEYCIDDDGRPNADDGDVDMPGDVVWDPVPREINRMVCGNFLGCRCAAGPCGDCDGGYGY